MLLLYNLTLLVADSYYEQFAHNLLGCLSYTGKGPGWLGQTKGIIV